jgi:type I restriction enzyme S subunit
MLNWKIAPLGEVLTFQRGFDITKDVQRDGPYSVISSSGPKTKHAEFKVRGPGVVVGRKGSLGTVFYSAADYWPHDTTLWVKDFHGNDPRFAYYFLQTMGFERFDAGASNPSLNRNHIHTITVHWPPITAQRRIAGILSAYDELIENSQRRINILEEMARALYREWFVDFRFPGHEKIPRFASPLGEIPEGWEVKRVPECVDIDPRVVVPRSGEKPFVPMGCLANDSMLITGIESRDGNSGAKFQNGDTLFARITPCLENGKTGFVQFLPDAQAVAYGSTEFIVLRSRTLTPEFVYVLARSEEFRSNAIKSMSGASGRQRVQERCFDDFKIARPPRALLGRFSAFVAPSFRLIYRLNLQIQNLRRTRDLLLPRLLSGQVDIV